MILCESVSTVYLLHARFAEEYTNIFMSIYYITISQSFYSQLFWNYIKEIYLTTRAWDISHWWSFWYRTKEQGVMESSLPENIHTNAQISHTEGVKTGDKGNATKL